MPLSEEQITQMSVRYLKDIMSRNSSEIYDICKRIRYIEKMMDVTYEEAYQFVKEICSLSSTLDTLIAKRVKEFFPNPKA